MMSMSITRQETLKDPTGIPIQAGTPSGTIPINGTATIGKGMTTNIVIITMVR